MECSPKIQAGIIAPACDTCMAATADSWQGSPPNQRPGEAQVGPGGGLGLGGAQKVGSVVSDDGRHPGHGVSLRTQRAQWIVATQSGLGCCPAHQKQHSRLHAGQRLRQQVGSGWGLGGWTVGRRQGAKEHLRVPVQLQCTQHVAQQATGFVGQWVGIGGSFGHDKPGGAQRSRGVSRIGFGEQCARRVQRPDGGCQASGRSGGRRGRAGGRRCRCRSGCGRRWCGCGRRGPGRCLHHWWCPVGALPCRAGPPQAHAHFLQHGVLAGVELQAHNGRLMTMASSRSVAERG